MRLLSLFSSVVVASSLAAQQSSAKLPNIVVLYADDLGFGDLGCYNRDSKIPTPSLDRLARQGMRLTDAHSSSGICTPSRYSLLTGRHHWRKFHRIVGAFGSSVIDDARLTMPEMLRAKGYRTACIGKWHLGWDWARLTRPEAKPVKGKGYSAADFAWNLRIPDGPTAHGFDYYFGDDVPNFPPYAWIENDRVVVAPSVPYVPNPKPPEGSHEGRPGPMVAGWRLDAVMPELTRRAVAWIEARKGEEQPFFLYFPFTSPHAPIVPSEEFAGSSKAGPYGDFVAQTDATVGALLAALDRGGLRDDTLVVFSADNGPERYAYERMRQFGHKSPGELRGLKRDVFEGGHRVPMIVRWPGVVAPGVVSDAMTSQCDLMATFARIVDAELPDDAAEDSFDQFDVWRGEAGSVRPFLIHNTFKKKWAMRVGRWLLLVQKDGYHSRVPKWLAKQYPVNPYGVMLCDLSRDPGQRDNLCEQHPGRVRELEGMLTELRDRGHSAPRLSTNR